MDEPGGAPGDPVPGTPQSAALAWVRTVVDDGDLLAAWRFTDPDLRLVLAQDWVWANRHAAIGHDADWDDIARGLAASPPEHPLWEPFAADLVSRWRMMWRGPGSRPWTVAGRTELVTVDLEVVTFLEAPAAPGAAASGAVARRFAVRHTERGWVVAGLNGEQLFRPGWPPAPEPA